jgi:hypothetical protein
MAVTRRHVRTTSIVFLLLGVAALMFDLLSQNPEQLRYVLGAAFLIGLSILSFYKARD